MERIKVSQVCVLLEHLLEFKSAKKIRLEMIKELEYLEAKMNERA